MNWYKQAKKATSPAELKALRSLVQKIMKGKRDWTPEELQIQSNFPEQVEEILMRTYNELV